MMAEAKKMMESPEFKKQMKQFEKSKDFKEATKKTQKMMDDPQQAARMAAQMEHMVNSTIFSLSMIFLLIGIELISLHNLLNLFSDR